MTDCTCLVSVSLPIGVEPDEMPPAIYRVIHCPMHKATLELLEKAKSVLLFVDDDANCPCGRCDTIRNLKSIVAKAKGNTDD